MPFKSAFQAAAKQAYPRPEECVVLLESEVQAFARELFAAFSLAMRVARQDHNDPELNTCIAIAQHKLFPPAPAPVSIEDMF